MAREAAGRPPEETLLLWKREQAQLKARVVDRDTEAWQRDPAFSGLQRVGGVDVSFVKGDSVNACASLVVLSYPELEASWPSERRPSWWTQCGGCRRGSLTSCPRQVLLVDGNGVLHHRGDPALERQGPRGCGKDTGMEVVLTTPADPCALRQDPPSFGVACHLGVLTDLPCVGVAKKLLQVDGLENNALHKEKIRLLRAGGDTFPLMGGSGTVLGMALKSHDHSTKPLYVSVGHKVSLEAAVRLTRGCCKFRIPEPVRQADIRSQDYIRRTLGVPRAPTPGQERSRKAQNPRGVCPKGGSEEATGEGRPPEGHSTQEPWDKGTGGAKLDATKTGCPTSAVRQ
ncbi:endonuclease V isoform X2 [Manis pentadactyla]|uniref:endonuclease V isoform X2 n=1 Tax=Manis pentadactyla TaxID=143292 RepID=UPI00255C778A|nr:endonuclease V isoform X2 [Manis pentadactyla]